MKLWTMDDGSAVPVLDLAAVSCPVPAWLMALRRQYPGVLEQRAMEYMAKPDRVASGRERLGE